MPTWDVTGSVPVYFTMTVNAATADEAEEKVLETWPGLVGYAGNGAMSGRLVGHQEENLSLDAPTAEIEPSINGCELAAEQVEDEDAGEEE